MAIKGSCLCGGVTFEISGTPIVVGNCHCPMCRKSHGAAFVTWIILGPGQFRWTAGEDLIQAYSSSPDRERLFCRECGTRLASSHGGAVSEVLLGTVDGDPELRPVEHIFVGSKAPWYEIADELPQHQEWPPGMQP